MLDWLKHALEWLKTPTQYFLPLLVVSAFGLFAPSYLLEQLGIAQWRTDGKFYLGSLFVVSLSVIFCHYFAMFINWVLNWYGFYRRLWIGHARLKSLTADEQNIIRVYLEKNSKAQLLNAMNGIVMGLVEASIIYPSVEEGEAHSFPFNIRNWAWIYLNKNPNLVIKNVIPHTKNP